MAARTALAGVSLLLAAFSTSTLSQQPLPQLALSERPGGQSVEGAVADGSGGVWIAGAADGTLAPTADAFQPLPRGDREGYLAHIGSDGALLYATYLGGSFADEVSGVARDAAGNVYVAGSTSSSDFPTTAGAYRRGVEGGWDAFVVKFDPSGHRILYSTLVGGGGLDLARGLAVDAGGIAHVAGTSPGPFPVTVGSLCRPGSSFYARLSADGSALLNAMCLDNARARGVAVDANGDAYVAGEASRGFSPLMNPAKVTFPPDAGLQGFLARFSGNTIPFSTLIGGSNTDWATAVAVTSKGIYIAGTGYSTDYPGAPARTASDRTAWITKVRPDGAAVLGTTLLDGNGGFDEASALQVDASEVVHVTGHTDSSTFPATADAAQPANAGRFDAFYATIWMPQNVVGDPSYVSYLGGSAGDEAPALALDADGGAWIAGDTTSADFPRVNAKTSSFGAAFVARFGQPHPSPSPSGDIVLYARDASAIAGAWQLVADPGAAAGTRIWNPDAGVPKIGTAAAIPANYFELTFQAQAGVGYRLWLRMKADNDAWQNDSVFVQFSDSVDGSGNPVWRIDSTSATVVSLEDCSGCGEHGWGWNDNGYNTAGTLVRFATSGTHTLRAQQREDGISIDQIVLSSGAFVGAAPGANKDDTTILEPPPPPPAARTEIVRYAVDATFRAGIFQLVGDSTAAAGARLWNQDFDMPKLTAASADPRTFFEITFDADPGVPYQLWLRMKADNDSWQNDSVFVQFSDSVDGSGNAVWRIGTTSATMVSLEDCSGCGEQGWGWNDNGYATPGARVVFGTSGPHTLRVQTREDGISIDQIVLSAAKYLTQAPGAAKNDSTIIPR